VQTGVPTLQPGVGTAVDLHQHTCLGHTLAPDPVVWWPTLSRAGKASLCRDAPRCGASQGDPLALGQDLG
jgi:hypothetical protein